jgi:hypothetical protein
MGRGPLWGYKGRALPDAGVLARFHPGTAGHADTLTGDQPAFGTRAAERLLGWEAALQPANRTTMTSSSAARSGVIDSG